MIQLNNLGMSKLLLLFIIFSFSIGTYAQSINEYSDIKLETDADYKAAEPMALKAANYILSTPSDNENMERIYAFQMIMAWMEGTPDYNFDLEALEHLGDDIYAKTVYIASIVKFRLENNTQDEKQILLGTWNIFLDYCVNPDNRVKNTAAIKKFIRAREKGTLEEELSLQ